MSVYKAVWVCVRVHVLLHLYGYISFIYNLECTKIQAKVVVTEGRPN